MLKMPSKDLVMPNEDEDENISMYQNYPLTKNPSTLLHSSIFGKIQTKKLDLQDLIRMKNKIQNEKQIRDLKVSEEDMKNPIIAHLSIQRLPRNPKRRNLNLLFYLQNKKWAALIKNYYISKDRK
jgi:hypothetical protein